MSLRTNAKFVILCLCQFILFEYSECFDYSTIPASKVTRGTTFVPKVLDKTCLLKPELGPCRGNVTMYYFRPSIFNCSRFRWGGCQGNGNRFDTFQQCTNTCISSPSRRELRPVWCNLRYDYGYCFGAVTRYYFDSIWKTCKEAIYSGCGGNKNNFYSREQCDQVCRFGNGPIIASKSKDKHLKTGTKKVLIINPWNASTKRDINATQTIRQRDWNATSAATTPVATAKS